MAVQILEGWVKGVFLFCFIWSFGASTNHEGRPKFDQFVRQLYLNQVCPKRVCIVQRCVKKCVFGWLR